MGGGRDLRYSVILPSGFKGKIKAQNKRINKFFFKIPKFTLPENHFFDQTYNLDSSP